MVKKHTTMNIDHEVLEKAKEMGMNLSKVSEDALKKKFGIVEVDTQVQACEFCGVEMEKAKAQKHKIGLVWLSPDEMWWCQKCQI